MPPAARLDAFRKVFDPEYLASRKDIAPVMVHAARGNVTAVSKYLADENPFEIYNQNRDGNTLLLLAVANKHVELTKLLLSVNSEIDHVNQVHMDALDYAILAGPRSGIAKAVLQCCDYVTPDILHGPYWNLGQTALDNMKKENIQVARASLLGPCPDFSESMALETDYMHEWIKSLNTMVSTVRKGLLLPSSEIAFLERDAVLTGALEVPVDKRFVYNVDTNTIVKFTQAQQDPAMYGGRFDERLIQACSQADDMAVRGLLKAKAHPNVEDVRGQTVLMRAANRGDIAVMRCLLVAKANVNASNKDGYTALLLAGVSNKEAAVQLLLQAKGDPSTSSNRGNTVLSFVKHEGHKDILHVIRAHNHATPKARGTSASRRGASRTRSRWRTAMHMH